MNKINKPLANMTKWRREKTQIYKIRDEKHNMTTNTNKIQRIIMSTLRTYTQVNSKL
jgi:hypothetical protein